MGGRVLIKNVEFCAKNDIMLITGSTTQVAIRRGQLMLDRERLIAQLLQMA
jgi:hypothetical protein